MYRTLTVKQSSRVDTPRAGGLFNPRDLLLKLVDCSYAQSKVSTDQQILHKTEKNKDSIFSTYTVVCISIRLVTRRSFK